MGYYIKREKGIFGGFKYILKEIDENTGREYFVGEYTTEIEAEQNKFAREQEEASSRVFKRKKRFF